MDESLPAGLVYSDSQSYQLSEYPNSACTWLDAGAARSDKFPDDTFYKSQFNNRHLVNEAVAVGPYTAQI